MSDGGIGQGTGVTYFATINIKGDLSKEQLQAVVKKLKEIMKEHVTADGTIGPNGQPINGFVMQATRVSDGKSHTPGATMMSVPITK
jgi:hypothetical protein